ncbi:MAG: NAD-dependent epimerase/dehydratase family protein [Acidimicrobiales bacterium]
MESASLRRICVTGASGKAGRAVVRELLQHGYEVAATDIEVSREEAEKGLLRADLTDYGQALEVLKGVDAIIHLANIPAPGLQTPSVTFNSNMAMNFNIFYAAVNNGLSRVVWASSETTLGLFFGVTRQQFPSMEVDGRAPRYVPVDEDHYPFPTVTYALSKIASETIAGQISEWSGVPFVALRFSNIMYPEDYQEFPSYWSNPHLRKWNLWGYVDVRDVATACLQALTAPSEAVAGSPGLIIAAADTVMNRPSAELVTEVFPGVPLTRDIGEYETLLAINRARETIGYEPHYSWRDHIPES